jgi:hypothetical protein
MTFYKENYSEIGKIIPDESEVIQTFLDFAPAIISQILALTGWWIFAGFSSRVLLHALVRSQLIKYCKLKAQRLRFFSSYQVIRQKKLFFYSQNRPNCLY